MTARLYGLWVLSAILVFIVQFFTPRMLALFSP